MVHEARTPLSRLRGLAGLADLPPDVALLLPRTRSVHTLGMRFALDLVWLDGAGRPVRLDAAVKPGRHRACRRARAVVECRAGAGTAFREALAGPRADAMMPSLIETPARRTGASLA